MRTGDFKQTYGELVTLVDSPPVWLWSAVLIAALIAAPFVLNSYALSFLIIILITMVGTLGLNILTGYIRCTRWSASLARVWCRRSPASSSARRRCG